MLCTFLFILICLTSVAHGAPLSTESTTLSTKCLEIGDCVTISQNCSKPCSCDDLYIFSNTTNGTTECLLNQEYLKDLMTEKYNTEDILSENAEKIFRGIVVSAYIFIFCASFCALSACIYCCHVNYSDRKLHKDVKALAEKLNRDGKLKKIEKKQTKPIAESCNVIVEDAGVFVC